MGAIYLDICNRAITVSSIVGASWPSASSQVGVG